MLASSPASILNLTRALLGIPFRFGKPESRSSAAALRGSCSAKFLGESDEKPFRAADVAEPRAPAKSTAADSSVAAGRLDGDYNIHWLENHLAHRAAGRK